MNASRCEFQLAEPSCNPNKAPKKLPGAVFSIQAADQIGNRGFKLFIWDRSV
jgi:hypothetical protein